MTKACPVPGDLSYNCPSVYGNASCVPDAFSCDGDADCSEEEDEQGCDSGIIAIDVDVEDPEAAGCPTVLVHCGFPVKICVNEFLICDGQVDCPFGEDEEECGDADDTDMLTSTTLTTGMTTEKFTQDSRKTAECLTFYCGLSGSSDPSCVQEHLICDGQPDCTSGEDEQGCGGAKDMSTVTNQHHVNRGRNYARFRRSSPLSDVLLWPVRLYGSVLCAGASDL
ncbi:SCO-spondin-like [Branchiostoma floridae x Branchiostoma japonicum]